MLQPAGNRHARRVTRIIILAIRALYELSCMMFASQPLMLRDTEGRACCKPEISRTKLAINRSGSNTEKRGKKGAPHRAGRLTAAYLMTRGSNDENGILAGGRDGSGAGKSRGRG